MSAKKVFGYFFSEKNIFRRGEGGLKFRKLNCRVVAEIEICNFHNCFPTHALTAEDMRFKNQKFFLM